MRNVLLSIVVLLVCVFCACRKRKNGSTNVLITANVNNFPWVSTYATASISKVPHTQITIDADSANTHLELHLGNYTGAGTYNIADSANSAYYTSYSRANGPEKHIATTGTVIITNSGSSSNNQTDIQGMFDFTADAISVKTGTFDVHLNLD